MHHPIDRIAHTIAFVTPIVDNCLKREIAQWVHHEGSILDLSHHEQTFYNGTTSHSVVSNKDCDMHFICGMMYVR